MTANPTHEFSHFFEVKLDLFSGPIDLLLHLVKLNELPIEKLSLAQVTEQYLHCIESVRHFDLEVAGEYLVIAATLISIKASVILQEPIQLVMDEDGNMIDPHTELLQRLREAAIYKDGAQWLKELDYLGIDVFSSPSELKHVPSLPEEFIDHDPFLLGKAFQKLLNLAGNDQPLYTIMMESVSIVERMMGVLDVLKKSNGQILFHKLVPDLTSKASLIGTFVALLELCKRQVICVKQELESEEIFILLSGKDVDANSFTSEFDILPGEEMQEESIVNA